MVPMEDAFQILDTAALSFEKETIEVDLDDAMNSTLSSDIVS
jgi:molybdopterin biosynthesis enzyme